MIVQVFGETMNVNYICTPQNNIIAKALIMETEKFPNMFFSPRHQNTKGNPVEYANNITMYLLHVLCELLRFESVRVDVIL